jgi:hypothetical protein
MMKNDYSYNEFKMKYKEIFGRVIQMKSGHDEVNNLMYRRMDIGNREIHELVFEYARVRGIRGDEIDEFVVFKTDIMNYFKRRMLNNYNIHEEWLGNRRKKSRWKIYGKKRKRKTDIVHFEDKDGKELEPILDWNTESVENYIWEEEIREAK